MKTVFIIAIVAVAMIGVMVPSVFAQSDVIFGKTVIENVTPSEESVFKPITIKPFQNTYVKNSDMKFNIRILDSFDKPIFIILKDSEKNILYTKEVFAPTGEINVKLRLDFIPLLARGDLLELIVSHNENQQNKKFYIILYDIRFNQFDKNGNPEAYTWTDTATLTAILPEANLDPLNIDSVHMANLYTVSGCTGTLILYETGIDTMEFDVMIQFIPYNEETIFEESCFTQISNSPTATLIVKENDGVQTGLQWQGMGVGLGAMIKPLEKEIIQHIHGFHIAYDVPEYKELLQIIGDKELSGSGSVSALIEFPDGTIKSEKTQFEEDGSFEILFDLPVNSIVGIYGVSIFDNSGVIDNIQIIVTDKKPFGSKSETVEETLIVNAPVIETPITPELISEPEPLGIALFVDQTKDPQHYIDRYNNEPSYKEWFDDNYSQYSSIYQAVGLEESIVEEIKELNYTLEPEYVPEPTVTQTSTMQTEEKSKGGGCLIATATYGSELAPQVQQLRELRDNQLLQTESGTAFMSTFNDIYYSFSPIIADYERENPLFKEIVKLAITPMISSLSLMENANSESEVLSIGISVIMLNLGMYLGVPAIVVIGIRKKF